MKVDQNIFQDDSSVLDIKNKICEEFHDWVESKQLIVRDEFFICAKEIDADTLETIRTSIIENGTSYPNFGDVIPQTWRDLHLELDKLRTAGKKIIPFEEVQRINSKLPSPLEEEELEVFVAFLHAMGYCLHFNEGELAKHMILEPKWIIDAMKVIVTWDGYGKKLWGKKKWDEVRSTGQVKESYIIKQWQMRDAESFREFNEYLLLVLEKLDIICRGKHYNINGEEDHTDFFLVPCMVNVSIPATTVLQERSLDIQYTFPSVVPIAIYNRLVCACLVQWQVDNDHLYSGLVILKSGQYHRIKLQMKDGKILVSFVHLESIEKIDVHLCRAVRQFLNTALNSIMKTYKADTKSQNLYKIEYNGEAKARHFCNTEVLVNMNN